MNFSIYLAGKIPKGKEIDTFVDWREDFSRMINEQINNYPGISKIVCLDPHNFSMKNVDSVEDFFGRDVHLVHMSDAVIVDGRVKVGPGSAQEMIIAKYYGKPVVTIIPKNSHYWKDSIKLRGGVVEYKHPFLFSTSDAVVQSFEDAAKWVLDYLSGNMKVKIKTIDILDSSQKQYLDNHGHKDGVLSRWKKELKGEDDDFPVQSSDRQIT